MWAVKVESVKRKRGRKVVRSSEMGEKRKKVVDEEGGGDVWYGSRSNEAADRTNNRNNETKGMTT